MGRGKGRGEGIEGERDFLSCDPFSLLTVDSEQYLGLVL